MKTFKGGVHVPDSKYLTEYLAVEQMPIVPEYFVALSQHIGAPANPVVKAGDLVAEGQLIAERNGAISANVHSPVSGEVVGLVKRVDNDGVEREYIQIKADGNTDNVVSMNPLVDPTPAEIVNRVAEAGIVGLGGAGFPTAVKLSPADVIDTLLINAAECEPYLNCDNRLMIENAAEVVEGALLTAKALGVSNVVFGVEANKKEAYQVLSQFEGIKVVLLKKKYPQGGEKQLVYATTKRKVPAGKLPSAVGVAVQNVGTVYAVYQAVVHGKPLYQRVMTVSGKGVDAPKNLLVRIGTPISAIMSLCQYNAETTVKVVDGGPMMGTTLANLNGVTTKRSSGLLALTNEETSMAQPTPCINCGKCVDACPMNLMPVDIDFNAVHGDFEAAVKAGAKHCMECGACAYVCPAKRQIVQSVRLTKNKTKETK